MEKDITILMLIEKLKSKMDFRLIEIVDYWDADLFAIGLKKENRLVYISTFHTQNNKKSGYDFDLEILNLDNIEKLNVIKMGRGVSELDLVQEIQHFLT